MLVSVLVNHLYSAAAPATVPTPPGSCVLPGSPEPGSPQKRGNDENRRRSERAPEPRTHNRGGGLAGPVPGDIWPLVPQIAPGADLSGSDGRNFLLCTWLCMLDIGPLVTPGRIESRRVPASTRQRPRGGPPLQRRADPPSDRSSPLDLRLAPRRGLSRPASGYPAPPRV